MPETLSSTLQAILALDEFIVQGYFVLIMPDTTTIQFATDEIVFDHNTFQNFIDELGEINTTIENPIDAVQITIQNLDTDFIENILTNRMEFRKAIIEIGEYYSNKSESLIELIPAFYGKPFNPNGTDAQLSFQVISPFDDGSTFVANRTLNDLCTFIYKDSATCGSTDSQATCNKRRGAVGGCNIDYRFGGFEFPDEPDPIAPGGGIEPGGGGGGGGLGTCPSVKDFVYIAPDSQKRAESVRIGDLLWNPIDLTYSKVIHAEIIENHRRIEIRTGNGCVSRSSETHKLLIAFDDNIGTRVENFVVGDLVLTYNNGTLEMSNICKIIPLERGDVMLIELENKHLYINGSKFNKGIVAHNRKEDGGDIIIL